MAIRQALFIPISKLQRFIFTKEQRIQTAQMTYNERLNECLAAIKRGDETKYYELHQLTYGPLMNVAKSYLIDKSYAETVMSDLYYKIYLYADHYDTSKDAKNYLWQIVKRKAFDYNRKCVNNKTVNIDDFPIFDNVDQFDRVNARIDIAKALKRVGAINAMIIQWTYRDGLTQEEIGKRLNMSKSAVCQRLNKTINKLSEYLK